MPHIYEPLVNVACKSNMARMNELQLIYVIICSYTYYTVYVGSKEFYFQCYMIFKVDFHPFNLLFYSRISEFSAETNSQRWLSQPHWISLHTPLKIALQSIKMSALLRESSMDRNSDRSANALKVYIHTPPSPDSDMSCIWQRVPGSDWRHPDSATYKAFLAKPLLL